MKIRALMILLFLNFGGCFAQNHFQKMLACLYKNYCSYNKKILFGQSFGKRERLLLEGMNFGVGGLIVLGIGGYSLHRYQLRNYWDKTFFESIGANNVKLLSVAIDQGAPFKVKAMSIGFCGENYMGDLSITNRVEMDALHYAAFCGAKKCVIHLVGCGWSIDGLDNTGRTSLYWAIHNNDVKMAEILLKEGANPNTVDGQGCTALHLVAYKGNLDMLQVLLKEKIDIRSRDNNGCTPLHKAFQYFKNRSVQEFDYQDDHKIKVIEHLLESGALLSDVDKEGRTPLDYCDNEKVRFKLACILEGEIKKNTAVKDLGLIGEGSLR